MGASATGRATGGQACLPRAGDTRTIADSARRDLESATLAFVPRRGGQKAGEPSPRKLLMPASDYHSLAAGHVSKPVSRSALLRCRFLSVEVGQSRLSC